MADKGLAVQRAAVDADKTKATLKNGVLEIELAKVAPVKTVKVETQGA